MKKKCSISFLIVFIIILLILPMNIFMLYSAYRSQEIILEHTQMNMENMANLYINELQLKIESVNNYVADLEKRNVFLEDITQSDNWDYYYIAGMGLRQNMNEHMVTSKDADMYFYYSETMQHGMLVENSEEMEKGRLQEVLFSERDYWNQRKWKILEIDNTKWIVHINHWKNAYIGSGIQLDSLESFILNNMENETLQAHITNQENIEATEDVLTVTKQCGKLDVYLHIQVEKEKVIHNLPVLQRLGYKIALIELLSIPVMILVIRFLVLKPLKILKRSLNQLKTEPGARIQENAFTEDFDAVFRSFNSMADEIVQLKIDNYESELERQKVELRNLQLQVKPHFLFNSLHLMYNLVELKKYKSVQKMLLYFSNYFRYINVGENDFSLFQEEFELIKEYLEISQIRYPDIFDVEYQIEDSVKEVLIPQLLIHNFVENVMKHGLVLQRKTHIVLKAYVEENKAVFCVQDDGIGMSKEQAYRINCGEFQYKDGKKHLGLKNSFRRVRYFYGEQGNIHIDAEENKGTKVTVKIPVRISGEGKDEITNCK